MDDKTMLELATIMQLAGIHPAIVIHAANGHDVMLSARDITAIVRAAAAIGAKGE